MSASAARPMDETSKGRKIDLCNAEIDRNGHAASCREIRALNGLRCAGFEHHPYLSERIRP